VRVTKLLSIQNWMDKDLVLKSYSDKELDWLTAAAEGLAALVNKHKRSLGKEDGLITKETLKSQELPGHPEIELMWPHPKLSPPALVIEEGNFGLAKSIAALALKNGVDFSNPKEIEKFMKACNAASNGFNPLPHAMVRETTPSPKDK
jgi:hypothetical protein